MQTGVTGDYPILPSADYTTACYQSSEHPIRKHQHTVWRVTIHRIHHFETYHFVIINNEKPVEFD